MATTSGSNAALAPLDRSVKKSRRFDHYFSHSLVATQRIKPEVVKCVHGSHRLVRPKDTVLSGHCFTPDLVPFLFHRMRRLALVCLRERERDFRRIPLSEKITISRKTVSIESCLNSLVFLAVGRKF